MSEWEEGRTDIMKQKYTLNIADVQMNVVADIAPEQVSKIAGILDRKMREYYLNSRSCTKNEAALLCALEFCSERLELQSHTAELQTLNAKYETVLQALQDQNSQLKVELEKLKSENTLLRSLITTRVPAADTPPVQAAGTAQGMAQGPAKAPAKGQTLAARETPLPESTPSPVSAADFLHEVATATESIPGVAQTPPPAAPNPKIPPVEPRTAEGSEADKRRSRMGSMFDLLSFDDD
jgi:cell division protein ZapA (FtsZ GTPase activity inhibitor)